MNRPSLVIVLAEDQRQKRFIYRFLISRGFRSDQMRMIISPSGRGSAECWVRENFALQMQICRTRHAKTGLIVLLDADAESVLQHHHELDDALSAQNQPKVDPARDSVTRLIPKWSIETWVLYLTSEGSARLVLTEDQPYKGTKPDDEWAALIPVAAATLAAWTSNKESTPEDLPNSLQLGITEIPRSL